MRLFIGIIATIIALTGVMLLVLTIWGINPISWDVIWKSAATIVILGGFGFLVYFFYHLFFRNYTTTKTKEGNRVRPMN